MKIIRIKAKFYQIGKKNWLMAPSRKHPQVYLDFMLGSKPIGRVVFELFTDLTPKTAENFRGLCTGDYGSTGLSGKNSKLYYENSKIHRIVENFCIQGGDITHGDGTGVRIISIK